MAQLSPRTVGLALGAAALLAVVALVVVFWQTIVLAAVGFAGIRFAAARAGVVRRRPRSSFASNVKALALLYAAWNSRWLKPAQVAKVHARTEGTVTTPEGVVVVDRNGPSDPIPF